MLTTDEISSLTVATTTPDTKLNLKLIQALADSELTLKEIAKAAGLSTATIRNMCTNKYTPQKKTARRLSNALKKSPCTFGFTCDCLSCTAPSPELLAMIERGNDYFKRTAEPRWVTDHSSTDTAAPAEVSPAVEEHKCPTCIKYEVTISQIRGILYCALLFLILHMAVELMSWFQ